MDDLVDSGQMSIPTLLKMDVQGYELEVLKGAERTLESVEAVLAEVSFYPFADGLPTVEEIIIWLREHGFAWYDVMGILRYQPEDYLGHLDLMFVRTDHPLRRKFQKW